MTNLSLIYITCPNEKEAEKLAKMLLEAKLIACANIISNMKALYVWQGKLNRDTEVILLLKTKSENFLEIEKLVEKEHSYECPCIIEIDIKKTSNAFQDFLISSL